MTPPEVDEKFHRLADPAIGAARADRVVRLARGIDKLANVRALAGELVPAGTLVSR